MLPLPDLRGIIAPMSHTSPSRAALPARVDSEVNVCERTVSSRLPLAAEDDRTEVGSYLSPHIRRSRYGPPRLWRATPGRRCSRSRRQGPSWDVSPYPFCRKRCHFCYFRVSPTRTRRRWRRISMCSRGNGSVTGNCRHRRPSAEFRVIGGGTPSFLSTQQLEGLVARLSAVAPWRDAVTFECEPGR